MIRMRHGNAHHSAVNVNHYTIQTNSRFATWFVIAPDPATARMLACVFSLLLATQIPANKITSESNNRICAHYIFTVLRTEEGKTRDSMLIALMRNERIWLRDANEQKMYHNANELNIMHL